MKNLVFKYCYFGFNILLIILIGVVVFLEPNNKVLATSAVSKSLNTKKLSIPTMEIPKEEVPADTQESVETPNQVVEKVEQQIVSNVVPASVVTDVLETQVGTMSAYGPDCVGCSGHLAGGFDASGGAYIYHDPTYGDVRIVAGDPSYPIGSIFRVKGSKLGDFNVIVLDRGGAIGIGRRFLFDLLFSSEAEASQFGTSYNVTFELLRRGR